MRPCARPSIRRCPAHLCRATPSLRRRAEPGRTDGHDRLDQHVESERESLFIANADGTGQRALTHAASASTTWMRSSPPTGGRSPTRPTARRVENPPGRAATATRTTGCRSGAGPVSRLRGADLDLGRAAVPPEGARARSSTTCRPRRPQWSVDIDGSRPSRLTEKRELGKPRTAGRSSRPTGRSSCGPGQAVRRQGHGDAGRRRRRRPSTDPAVGAGRRGLRRLVPPPRPTGAWSCSRPTAGAIRTRRRRPRHVPIALQQHEAMREEDRLAN